MLGAILFSIAVATSPFGYGMKNIHQSHTS
jgi:hypothetical protein